MVTAELALAVPTLLVLLSICLGLVGVVAARIRCIDAAGVAARLAARGESSATVAANARAIAAHSVVTVRRWADGFVEVRVRERVRLPVIGGVLPGVTVAERIVVPDETAVVTGSDP
jgi:Flp pilus assembly protein TadG